ncbi:hypothetical protein BDW62DRAFT_203286 [Aspergillus aurantiobrunneus]
MASAVAPITGMLRRNLVLDLSTAFGKSLPTRYHRSAHARNSTQAREKSRIRVLDAGIPELETITQAPSLGFGTTFGYLWWYGYHLPRVRARDNYYNRLEQERAAGQA